VIVKPKTIGIEAVAHNRYSTSSTLFAWQTDHFFIWIASAQAISL